MHELGFAAEIVKAVEDIMDENELTKVDSILLTIGEATGIVPSYMKYCFPAACDKTRLQGTDLEIRFIRAKGKCRSCGAEFIIGDNKSRCPRCCSDEFDIIDGREFEITEIRAH